MAYLLLRLRPRQAPAPFIFPSIRRHQCFKQCTLSSVSQPSPNAISPAYADVVGSSLDLNAANRQAQQNLQSTGKAREWELTIGIEIHAQLKTDRKLFSPASTAPTDIPNQHVAPFDLALPGAQPVLQPGVLLPALRAALALECVVQPVSSFDRKHYIYPDQPAGYQLTQFYAPLARDGRVRIYPHDGLAPADGPYVNVTIQQIQLEQDTAKTTRGDGGGSTSDDGGATTLLDFNRAGSALIEIITRPQIHHPATAAACVRKIQRTLEAVGALATGMERGGLRADVNVSVRPRPSPGAASQPLGQRTEIKNLSSFKAVEAAVVAERDRQIRVLEGGGRIDGETRGWTLGGTETRKLRGKEGAVDYRYMPDPDVPPLRIDPAVVEHLREHLPALPDQQIRALGERFGIQERDASILVHLDDGKRLDYFYEIIEALTPHGEKAVADDIGRLVFNWTIHELGSLLTASEASFESDRFPVQAMASILQHLHDKSISREAAKRSLAKVFDGDRRSIEKMINDEKLRAPAVLSFDYETALSTLASENQKQAEKLKAGQKGIQQFFVGQLMRRGGRGVNPQAALKAVEKFFGS